MDIFEISCPVFLLPLEKLSITFIFVLDNKLKFGFRYNKQDKNYSVIGNPAL
jgi:hypothetical protein